MTMAPAAASKRRPAIIRFLPARSRIGSKINVTDAISSSSVTTLSSLCAPDE